MVCPVVKCTRGTEYSPDGPGHKGQLLLCDPPGGHPQPEHTGLPALLGVAAIQPGKALVGVFVQLPRVKLRGLLREGWQVRFPSSGDRSDP